MNILVLCTGNSARSILLEAILGQDPRITAFSAGSKPAGKVNPGSLRLLKRRNYQTDSYFSKSWDVFSEPDAPKMDLVITVCGNARDEECPIWPGAPLRAHWGVEDPADATGSEAEIDIAFEEAYRLLKLRVCAFLALDFDSLDSQTMKDHLNKIAVIGA